MLEPINKILISYRSRLSFSGQIQSCDKACLSAISSRLSFLVSGFSPEIQYKLARKGVKDLASAVAAAGQSGGLERESYWTREE